MGRVSRRDAETLRGLLFLYFPASLRLCGTLRSLLRRGVSRRDAESLAGSKKNPVRSCRLQFDGVGQNVLDTVSVSGRTQPLRFKQPQPSVYADGSPWGWLERGGRHGLKPMLRRPSISSVTMPRFSFAEWLSAHGMAE
mgnify:CR=1 FL=1